MRPLPRKKNISDETSLAWLVAIYDPRSILHELLRQARISSKRAVHQNTREWYAILCKWYEKTLKTMWPGEET